MYAGTPENSDPIPPLKELQDVKGMVLTPEILRALSPYRQHPSRFGMYELRDRETEPIEYEVLLDLTQHKEPRGQWHSV